MVSKLAPPDLVIFLRQCMQPTTATEADVYYVNRYKNLSRVICMAELHTFIDTNFYNPLNTNIFKYNCATIELYNYDFITGIPLTT